MLLEEVAVLLADEERARPRVQEGHGRHEDVVGERLEVERSRDREADVVEALELPDAVLELEVRLLDRLGHPHGVEEPRRVRRDGREPRWILGGAVENRERERLVLGRHRDREGLGGSRAEKGLEGRRGRRLSVPPAGGDAPGEPLEDVGGRVEAGHRRARRQGGVEKNSPRRARARHESREDLVEEAVAPAPRVDRGQPRVRGQQPPRRGRRREDRATRTRPGARRGRARERGRCGHIAPDP